MQGELENALVYNKYKKLNRYYKKYIYVPPYYYIKVPH